MDATPAVSSPVTQSASQQNSPQGVGALRSRDNDEDDEDAKDKERKTDALLCSYETLGKAWPKNHQTQGEVHTLRVGRRQTRGMAGGQRALCPSSVVHIPKIF